MILDNSKRRKKKKRKTHTWNEADEGIVNRNYFYKVQLQYNKCLLKCKAVMQENGDFCLFFLHMVTSSGPSLACSCLHKRVSTTLTPTNRLFTHE